MEAMTDWVDDQIGIKLRAENIEEKHGVIFKWLQIVDSNALIIIILMTIVSVVNLDHGISYSDRRSDSNDWYS